MNSFFSATITEQNKFDRSIQNTTSLNISKKRLLQFEILYKIICIPITIPLEISALED